MSNTIKILCIEGGGVRGVFPAYILSCIEDRLNINLFETFDIVAGTSSGSIIASAIATQQSLQPVLDLFRNQSEEMYKKASNAIPFSEQIFASAYDSSSLAQVLEKQFENTTLGDIRKPLLIPATNITNGTPYIFKSNYAEKFSINVGVKLSDAILASCAAPSFFDPHKVDPYLLADGGVWANNPALVAIIEAQKEFGFKPENIEILTVGTGASNVTYGTSTNRKWGIVNGWGTGKFLELVLSLQSQLVRSYLHHIIPAEQIYDINFETQNGLTSDDHEVIDELVAQAEELFSAQAESILAFLTKE